MSTTTVAPVAVARAAAAAAATVPGVVALHGGSLGEIATYGGGGRVPGVRVRQVTDESGAARIEGVTVHVVAQYGRSLAAIADEVREVVTAACQAARPAEAAPGEVAPEAPRRAGTVMVDVHIADVRTEPVAIDPQS